MKKKHDKHKNSLRIIRFYGKSSQEKKRHQKRLHLIIDNVIQRNNKRKFTDFHY